MTYAKPQPKHYMKMPSHAHPCPASSNSSPSAPSSWSIGSIGSIVSMRSSSICSRSWSKLNLSTDTVTGYPKCLHIGSKVSPRSPLYLQGSPLYLQGSLQTPLPVSPETRSVKEVKDGEGAKMCKLTISLVHLMTWYHDIYTVYIYIIYILYTYIFYIYIIHISLFIILKYYQFSYRRNPISSKGLTFTGRMRGPATPETGL